MIFLTIQYANNDVITQEFKDVNTAYTEALNCIGSDQSRWHIMERWYVRDIIAKESPVTMAYTTERDIVIIISQPPLANN